MSKNPVVVALPLLGGALEVRVLSWMPAGGGSRWGPPEPEEIEWECVNPESQFLVDAFNLSGAIEDRLLEYGEELRGQSKVDNMIG